MRFSLDRVGNPLSRLVYASNCGGLQPSQINCARHECLGVSSPPVESNSPGCSDEAAGATGIVVRRTGVRRKASITGKWLSIRKAWWPHFRRHDSRIQSWLNPFCSSRREKPSVSSQCRATLWQQLEVPRFELSDALVAHGFLRPLESWRPQRAAAGPQALRRRGPVRFRAGLGVGHRPRVIQASSDLPFAPQCPRWGADHLRSR